MSRTVFVAKEMNMKPMVYVKNFLKDESGQTTTEYILILAVIVTIFMQFRNKLKGIITKIFGQLDDATGDIIEEDGG
jgi:Flp pilus assembly pilin Flp